MPLLDQNLPDVLRPTELHEFEEVFAGLRWSIAKGGRVLTTTVVLLLAITHRLLPADGPAPAPE